MLKYTGIILAASLLAITPACAGNLTFDNGITAWHSTQCVKPVPPNSIVGAHPETAGDDMNGLVAQHNAYVDAAQNYMNCIGNEADQDQTAANKTITEGARSAINDMQAEVDGSALAVRSTQK